MHPILNKDLLCEFWTLYPETKDVIERWLECVKAYETLPEILAQFPKHIFRTTDEKTVIFRFDDYFSLMATFLEKGVELKSIKYHTQKLFPKEVYH